MSVEIQTHRYSAIIESHRLQNSITEVAKNTWKALGTELFSSFAMPNLFTILHVWSTSILWLFGLARWMGNWQGNLFMHAWRVRIVDIWMDDFGGAAAASVRWQQKMNTFRFGILHAYQFYTCAFYSVMGRKVWQKYWDIVSCSSRIRF